MASAATTAVTFDEPFGQMNTTPLIDVLLVLLVMFILAVPPAVNQVPIDLPAPAFDHAPIDRQMNKISINPSNQITWNNQSVTSDQLASLLQDTRKLKPEPELRFEPDQAASYDTAAKVLQTIKRSGVTAFGFVGNDRFATFRKAALAH